MNNTFHIHNISEEPGFTIALEGHLLSCKCGRKLVVEIPLMGVSHNLNVIATCGECYQITNEKFKKEHSEVVQQIENFLKE